MFQILWSKPSAPPSSALVSPGGAPATTAASLRDGALGYSATLALRPSADPFLLPLASLLQVSKSDSVASSRWGGGNSTTVHNFKNT